MKKIDYTKIPKTFEGQVELLKQRGLTIPHEDKAIKVLKNISYNRLSSYWYPLLKEPKDDEIFKEGSSFETAFHFYQFDSELRILVFQAIEQIEISFRTQLIYHLSHKYNTGFWYEKLEAFSSFPEYLKVLNKVFINVKDTKQEFIRKYSRKYNQYLPPAWKSFEIISFRTVFSMYKNLSDTTSKKAVSKHFGLHHTVLISWLETLVYIRNICAHHSRLWNIKLTISPTWMKSPKKPWVTRWENEERNKGTNDKELKVYAVLCVIAYFLDHINPYHRFKDSLKSLIQRFPEVDLAHMGFTENWKEEDLWKEK
ncbi:MAG: Abi family protein [Bacteroidota bacterium]